jgi:mono/diheme cytochrome c family protein
MDSNHKIWKIAGWLLSLLLLVSTLALAAPHKSKNSNDQQASATASPSASQAKPASTSSGMHQAGGSEYYVPNSTHPAFGGAGLSLNEATSHIGNLVGNAHTGREEYRRFCIGCHGPLGNGEGENAMWIDPKPRDFTEGTFRCRSTPTGELPTDQDLYNTLQRGLVTTNMPSWIALTDQDKADLVAYLKIFSAKWKAGNHAAPIQIAPETPITAESIQRGHDTFEKMQCFKCHGQEGHGDGPSASTLTNSKDQPIRPYDFSQGERFKCGSTNVDIYRDFMTGLDGSPMPSFADQLKPEEAWDLVHYLRTLMVHVNSPERQIMIKNHMQFKNDDSGQ